MINLDKEKTCCFSGHRSVSKSFDKDKLKREIVKAIKQGYDTFLTGMAVGFDTICYFVLDELKSLYDIKIIACVPYINQAEDFSEKDKTVYDEILKNCDEVIFVSKDYYRGCLQKRNRFMVDNSSKIILFLNHVRSGTYYTYSYAKEKGIETVII